jgi:L-iditol 2-dehydrogenase
MLQAVMTAPGRIEFRDIPVPTIGEREVLVETMRIGICGSDIHVYHGMHPYTSYPVVQGHEVSGQIVRVGSGVSGFEKGDKVTVQPQVVCGECYPCTHGRYNICDNLKVMGFQTTGMASEFFAVDAAKVLKLPDRMDYDHGAMVEPLAVAVHALGRDGDVYEKNLLVLGAGPIGNLVAQAAKGMGAKKVMITDISDYRLGIAEKCGIDYCVNPTTQDVDNAIMQRYGREQADLILECVGVNATIEQAVQSARKGTDIVVVGVFGEKPTVDMGLVQDHELRLIGSLMYREEDFRRSIELIDKNDVQLNALISEHFDFGDYLQAYQHIDDKKDEVLKIILKLGA